MKKLVLILVAFIGMLSSCNNSATSKKDSEQLRLDSIQAAYVRDSIEKHIQDSINNHIQDSIENVNRIKYLITNNSVGFFHTNDVWKPVNEKYYQYNDEEAIFSAKDGCFHGGRALYTTKNKESDLVLESVWYDEKDEFDEEMLYDHKKYAKKYAHRNDLYFLDSYNCPAWFYKDSVESIKVISSKYTLEEGIGVGSTIKELLTILGPLDLYIGWISEDGEAIQLSTPKYPNIRFIIDSEYFYEEKIDYEKDYDQGRYRWKIRNTQLFKKNAKVLFVKVMY